MNKLSYTSTVSTHKQKADKVKKSIIIVIFGKNSKEVMKSES